MAAPTDDMLRTENSSDALNFPGDFSGASQPAPDTGTSEFLRNHVAISAKRCALQRSMQFRTKLCEKKETSFPVMFEELFVSSLQWQYFCKS